MNTTLLSVKDIQDRWNVSRQTVQTAISKKNLKGKKDARTKRWLFELAEVIRWRGGEPYPTTVAPTVVEVKESDPEIVALLKQQLDDQKNNHQKQMEDKDKEIDRLVIQVDRVAASTTNCFLKIKARKKRKVGSPRSFANLSSPLFWSSSGASFIR